MKTILYPSFKEKVFYTKLKNGLKVIVIPKNEYFNTTATLSVNLGSINEYDFLKKRESQLTLGSAHFLEHIILENSRVNALINSGIYINGATTFTNTSYVLKTNNHIIENINSLIEIVLNPKFDDEEILKEKKIIKHEIDMYQDDPEWISRFKLLENCFISYPIKYEIGGTVDTVKNIDKKILNSLYNHFYQPNNMLLVICTPLSPDFIFKNLSSYKGTFTETQYNQKSYIEPSNVANKFDNICLPIKNSRLFVGFKYVTESSFSFKDTLTLELLMEYLFSKNSSFFLKLKKRNIIIGEIDYNIHVNSNIVFVSLNFDTSNLLLAKELILSLINHKDVKISEDKVLQIKNKKIGNILKASNSIEWLVSSYIKEYFNTHDFFTIIEKLKNISIDDLKNMRKLFFYNFAYSILEVSNC